MDNRKYRNAISERRITHEVSTIITLELCLRTISWLTQGVGTQAKYSNSADLRKQRSEWYCCSYWNLKGWVLEGRELAGCRGNGLTSLNVCSSQAITQGWAVHSQSSTQGLPEVCCYQAESQKWYGDQAVLVDFGVHSIRWERPW